MQLVQNGNGTSCNWGEMAMANHATFIRSFTFDGDFDKVGEKGQGGRGECRALEERHDDVECVDLRRIRRRIRLHRKWTPHAFQQARQRLVQQGFLRAEKERDIFHYD